VLLIAKENPPAVLEEMLSNLFFSNKQRISATTIYANIKLCEMFILILIAAITYD
jgi:hypothetical protein